MLRQTLYLCQVPGAGGPIWKLRRCVFRRDFFRKVRSRVRRYWRKAERNSFDDIAFASARTSTPKVVFDVGANIGLVTSTLLKQFQPLFVEMAEHLSTFGCTLFNIYSPAESSVRQALFGDALFVSDGMRRRLLATYGPAVCGWSDKSWSAKVSLTS